MLITERNANYDVLILLLEYFLIDIKYVFFLK